MRGRRTIDWLLVMPLTNLAVLVLGRGEHLSQRSVHGRGDLGASLQQPFEQATVHHHAVHPRGTSNSRQCSRRMAEHGEFTDVLPGTTGGHWRVAGEDHLARHDHDHVVFQVATAEHDFVGVIPAFDHELGDRFKVPDVNRRKHRNGLQGHYPFS